MARTQTVAPADHDASERGVVAAIFAALTTASSFVPLGSTHPPAPLAPPQPFVPRFRGWIER